MNFVCWIWNDFVIPSRTVISVKIGLSENELIDPG